MIRLREREREECYRKERGRSVIVARNGEGKWSVRGERERGKEEYELEERGRRDR